MRGYARALAGAGETDRAVSVLCRLADVEKGLNRPYDLRLAAMYLLLAGRSSEASRMLDSIPAFPRRVSLDIVATLFEEPTRGFVAEQYAFRAFSISEDDLEANRYIMRQLWKEGNSESAVYFARRVQRLAAGDAEAGEVIGRAQTMKPLGQLTVPAGIDSL